jgi:hypothetical protein
MLPVNGKFSVIASKYCWLWICAFIYRHRVYNFHQILNGQNTKGLQTLKSKCATHYSQKWPLFSCICSFGHSLSYSILSLLCSWIPTHCSRSFNAPSFMEPFSYEHFLL